MNNDSAPHISCCSWRYEANMNVSLLQLGAHWDIVARWSCRVRMPGWVVVTQAKMTIQFRGWWDCEQNNGNGTVLPPQCSQTRITYFPTSELRRVTRATELGYTHNSQCILCSFCLAHPLPLLRALQNTQNYFEWRAHQAKRYYVPDSDR